MLTLCGIGIGINPLLVVTVAAVATGLAARLDPVAVISALGRAFTQNRYVGIVWLVLPVIGLLERAGLRERARMYLVVQQLAAALGLTALGGHAEMVRPPALAPLREARRLVETIGWAAVLPQMLAAIAVAEVGTVIAGLLNDYVPLDTPLLAVAAYAIGMALFTALMDNAYAAFPVMTAAIGLPLVAHKFGGDPAVVRAFGVLSGFCGTLVMPMAANFNVVLAALLKLPDRNRVIRVQSPTALIFPLGNIVLMHLPAFPR